MTKLTELAERAVVALESIARSLEKAAEPPRVVFEPGAVRGADFSAPGHITTICAHCGGYEGVHYANCHRSLPKGTTP